jgi:putative transposase
VIFIDAIVVKVRDGQVRNKPIYVVIGVTINGERDILGLWAGDGSEGAKFWLQILSELKNRGVADVCIAVCDGLKGLPDAINTVWDLTTVQACIIHLIRNSATARGSIGIRSRTICGRSIPPLPRPRPGPGSRNSPRSGANHIRRSSGCGRTPGLSSCRFWTTEPVAECVSWWCLSGWSREHGSWPKSSVRCGAIRCS